MLVVKAFERFLQQVHRLLAGVPWSLRAGAFVVLVAASTLHFERWLVPGPKRVMTSRTPERFLRRTREDRGMDFPAPRLRRDFYRVGPMEVHWSGPNRRG